MENVRELKTVFEEFVTGDYVYEDELNIIEEFGVEAIVEYINNIKIENLNDLQIINKIYWSFNNDDIIITCNEIIKNYMLDFYNNFITSLKCSTQGVFNSYILRRESKSGYTIHNDMLVDSEFLGGEKENLIMNPNNVFRMVDFKGVEYYISNFENITQIRYQKEVGFLESLYHTKGLVLNDCVEAIVKLEMESFELGALEYLNINYSDSENELISDIYNLLCDNNNHYIIRERAENAYMDDYNFRDYLNDLYNSDLVDIIADYVLDNDSGQLNQVHDDYYNDVYENTDVYEWLEYNFCLKDMIDDFDINKYKSVIWVDVESDIILNILDTFILKGIYFTFNSNEYVFKKIDEMSGYKTVSTRDNQVIVLKVNTGKCWVGGSYGSFNYSDYSTKLRAEHLLVLKASYLDFQRNGFEVSNDIEMLGLDQYCYSLDDYNKPSGGFSFNFEECESGMHFFKDIKGLKSWVNGYRAELNYLQDINF